MKLKSEKALLLTREIYGEKHVKIFAALVFMAVLSALLFFVRQTWAQSNGPPHVPREALRFILRGDYLGATVTDSVILSHYHPWDENNMLARLDSTMSFRINNEFPILDGATSAYPIYAAVANEVYLADDKEKLQQYLHCSKTERAYNRLIEGKADIIFVLQPSDEQLESAKNAGVELRFTPIAKDAFVFFVNSRNPVSDLSVEQIRDIYLRRITNWRDVGGNNRQILPFQRPENSGSQTAMIKNVMKGENLPSPLEEELHFERRVMSGIVFAVAQYRDYAESIGYSFRFFTDEMMFWQRAPRRFGIPTRQIRRRLDTQDKPEPVKLLAVNGIAPNDENIRNGTYPFTVNVYAATAGTKNPHAQELIEWILSPQGQELIEKTGYVGVATNVN